MVKKLPDEIPTQDSLRESGLYDESKARDAVCAPIAAEIIRLIAAQKEIPVGAHIHQDTTEDYYKETVYAVLKILVDKQVKIMDTVYIFNLVREAISVIQETVDTTLNENMNRVTEAMYGLGYGKSHDITVADLEKVLKHGEEIKDVWADKIAE